jgi:hypothetical protein
MKRYKQTTTFVGNPYYRPKPEPLPEVVQPDARPYLHTVEAGAELPLIQSVVWGVIGGALALVIAIAKKQWWTNCLTWGAGAFVVTFGLAWLTYQRHWFRLASLERLLNTDIDGDGIVGNDIPQVTINLKDTSEGGWHESTFDLPTSQEQLRSLAFGILAGVPYAEGHWIGRGQPFSKPAFYTLRAELMKRKLVEYVNPSAPAQGYRFTRTGMAVLRYFSPAKEQKGKP